MTPQVQTRCLFISWLQRTRPEERAGGGRARGGGHSLSLGLRTVWNCPPGSPGPGVSCLFFSTLPVDLGPAHLLPSGGSRLLKSYSLTLRRYGRQRLQEDWVGAQYLTSSHVPYPGNGFVLSTLCHGVPLITIHKDRPGKTAAKGSLHSPDCSTTGPAVFRCPGTQVPGAGLQEWGK